MKPTELRIGNLVDLGNRIAKVIEINHLSCVVVDLEETQDTIEDYDRTKAIPLTEEWFLRFGLLKTKEGIILMGCYQIVAHEESWRIILKNGVLSNIKYVHQLQNLYFALTCEEITFKSE